MQVTARQGEGEGEEIEGERGREGRAGSGRAERMREAARKMRMKAPWTERVTIVRRGVMVKNRWERVTRREGVRVTRREGVRATRRQGVKATRRQGVRATRRKGVRAMKTQEARAMGGVTMRLRRKESMLTWIQKREEERVRRRLACEGEREGD